MVKSKNKRKNTKRTIRKTKQILFVAGISILCASIVANIFQAKENISLAKQKDEDAISLQNYRDLQARQIEFVKNRCAVNYNKYGSEGNSDSNFREMMNVAVNIAPRYINVDSHAFVKDLLFSYLQSICLDPVMVLLGEDDIYGDNLNYFTEWGYFHFDDSDFDKVRW